MTTVGYGDSVPMTVYGFNNALHRSRLELKEHVEEALQDGIISDDEQQELDTLVRRLNLNKADVKSIMESAQFKRKSHHSDTCPHCHLPLDQIPKGDD